MDIRIIILCAALALLQACDCTDVDAFGQRTVVEVPIQSFPMQTTFSVGDTIWWSADFSDQVRVEGVDQRLDLANFNFFADFSIRHVPIDATLVESAIDVFADTGDLTFISGDEFLDFSIGMIEVEGRFKFKFGIVLRKAGVYLAGVNTLFDFDFYDHPGLYACQNTRREDFRIHYINSSTNIEAYETIFEPRATAGNIAASTFEKYVSAGSITFIVTE